MTNVEPLPTTPLDFSLVIPTLSIGPNQDLKPQSTYIQQDAAQPDRICMTVCFDGEEGKRALEVFLNQFERQRHSP